MLGKDGQMMRRVRCIEPVVGFEVGKIYIALEEEKPKVKITEGPWRGYVHNDPLALTYYTVIDADNNEHVHVPASHFELLPIKSVQYLGGWGARLFAHSTEIHAPLEKGCIYEVIGLQRLATYGLNPEFWLELVCNDKEILGAHSDNFKDVNDD